MAPINRRSLMRRFQPGPRLAPAVCELTVSRRAMACEFAITFPGTCRSAVDAGCTALDEIERWERKLSVFLPDSDLSRLNRRAASEPVQVDAEIYSLLQMASRIHSETKGAFDPAIGSGVRAWRQGRLAEEIRGSRFVVLNDEDRTVRFLRPEVEYNLGAIGKGFAIDLALASVRMPALMNGGQSSIRAIGTWMVAIGTVAHVRLRNQAIGTSAADNQFFVREEKRYGHILNPRTGRPAEGLLSASAIAASAAETDALSTAFFVLGIEGTREYCRSHPDVTAVLVAPDGVVVMGPAEVEVLQ